MTEPVAKYRASIWGPADEDVPIRVWAAKRTIRQHIDGTCPACPAGDWPICEALRCAIARLRRHSGLPGLYRAI